LVPIKAKKKKTFLLGLINFSLDAKISLGRVEWTGKGQNMSQKYNKEKSGKEEANIS